MLLPTPPTPPVNKGVVGENVVRFVFVGGGGKEPLEVVFVVELSPLGLSPLEFSPLGFSPLSLVVVVVLDMGFD